MNEAQKQKLIGELKGFYKELKSYKRQLNAKKELSEPQKRYVKSLRDKLIRKVGTLKTVVIGLTGKEYIERFGKAFNIWEMGLTAHRVSDICDIALDFCIDATNEAIGKLDTTPLPEPEPQGVSRNRTPEVSVADNGVKRPFVKVKEIEIRGDLGNLDPIIVEVAAELHFKGCDFEVRSANSNRTDTFALFNVFIIERTPIPNKIPIGAFTLKVPENNRVTLRVPPASQQTWGHLSPMEKIQMGLYGSRYNEHFNHFINSLESRFAHYGLISTSLKRLWQWLKSHKIFSILITAIMVIAAFITIWGFVSGAFS